MRTRAQAARREGPQAEDVAGRPQLLKDTACKAKSKAKSDAAKDPELEAGLAQKIEDIDAVCATNRRQLARAPVSLPWPARATVIATRAPPKPQAPVSKLARLRKAAAVAAEAAEAARCQYVASKRCAERVKRTVDECVAAQRAVLGQLCPRKLLE